MGSPWPKRHLGLSPGTPMLDFWPPAASITNCVVACHSSHGKLKCQLESKTFLGIPPKSRKA